MNMLAMTMPVDISESLGDTAVFVNQQTENSYEILQNSNVLGLAAKGTFQQLYEVFKECSYSGWDGEQAKPISIDVLRSAIKFLLSFPLGVESPDISAEPDGAITLEWYRSPNRVISISVNPDGLIYWAALVGPRRRHGKDYAMLGIHEDLQKIILQVIEGY